MLNLLYRFYRKRSPGCKRLTEVEPSIPCTVSEDIQERLDNIELVAKTSSKNSDYALKTIAAIKKETKTFVDESIRPILDNTKEKYNKSRRQ